MIFATLALLPLSSQAAEPERGFRFERSTWQTAPPELQLQPERARLVLKLPPELMPPAPEPGVFSAIDPNVYLYFGSAGRSTRASIGANMSLQINDLRHSLRLDIKFMPRGAFAELRFDPVAWVR